MILTQQFAAFAMFRFADGRLKPIIDSVWELDKVNDTHEYTEQNKNTGKIALLVNLF
jgi:tumor protein p53-inducible protein 3